METIGPVARRDATGPLRRLLRAKEVPRPAPRGRLGAYAVPLGLLVLTGLGLAAAAYLQDNRGIGWLVPVIAAGSVAPLAVTYRYPVTAWRIAFPMMLVGSIGARSTEPWPWNTVQILVFLLVLGRLAITQDTGVTLWATGLSLIPVFVYARSGNAWGAAVLLVAIAAVGDILSRRRRTSQLLAESEELTELERARRAVLEERTRIAREMHDVVAHHMSMIAVRAETAPYRLPELPPDARTELATIAGAAREALVDMRRLLGVLRAEQAEAETAPQPTFADIEELAGTARAAGVEVVLHTAGTGPVPATAGLAAYRIVQEALANAARHAPGKPVTVDAGGFPDRLELAIRNPLAAPPAEGPSAQPGPAVPAGRGGHGLVGMRERATLLGGTLSAGPADGDFVVTAVLPLTQEA